MNSEENLIEKLIYLELLKSILEDDENLKLEGDEK